MMNVRKEEMPDGEVRLWANGNDLILDPENAIGHGRKNLDRIKGSIKRYGQQTPVKIDRDNIVVKGNGTVIACRELGREVWFSRTELTGAERVGYGIADNKTSEDPDWQNDVLSRQLKMLADEGDEALDATGFTKDDLAELLKRAQDADDDDELGGGEPPAAAGEFLKWPGGNVPLTSGERDALNRAFAKYVEETGSSYGFVRSVLKI